MIPVKIGGLAHIKGETDAGTVWSIGAGSDPMVSLSYPGRHTSAPLSQINGVGVFVDPSYFEAIDDALNDARKRLMATPTRRGDTPVTLRRRTEVGRDRIKTLKDRRARAEAEYGDMTKVWLH